MSRKRFIIKRLVLLAPVLLGVATLVFAITRLSPGDPALVLAGKGASAERVETIRQQLGLTEPIWVQYGTYLWDLLHLRFGRSYIISRGTPVVELLQYRLPVTVELAFYGEFVGVLLGIPLGIVSALRQNSLTDHATRIGALFGFSVPVFWSGPIFILIFAQFFGVLPASGRLASQFQIPTVTGLVTVDSLLAGNFPAFVSAITHLALPVFVLGLYLTALISRMMRSTMLEEVRQDYIRTARAKGQGERITIIKHALRNALIPVVTVIGLQFGTLLGGAVLTETIFGISGIGLLLVDAIEASDYPVVQGTVLIFALLFTLVNLSVDVLYSYLDPRIEQ